MGLLKFVGGRGFFQCYSSLDVGRRFLSVPNSAFYGFHLFGNTVTITVPESTPAVIVLQQVDDRYFSDISGSLSYDFEFKVFKSGETEVHASSSNAGHWRRSQNCEMQLDAGEYVVHVSI